MTSHNTNSFCDTWNSGGWRRVSVQAVLVRAEAVVRCMECHGSIRLHRAGPNGVPRAHAEHLVGHTGCSLGHYFDGTRSMHPTPVLDLDGSGNDLDTFLIVNEDDESAFPEGTETFRLHRYLERDGALSRRAKAARLAETGKLECEVCATDFQEVYGELGIGFIEAHHRVPVYRLDGTSKTKIGDLALVCSNCHRMLHRADPQLTIKQLQERVNDRDTSQTLVSPRTSL